MAHIKQGGDLPHWRRDGRELFYQGADGRIMAVDVQTEGGFHAGQPKALFDVHNASWDVTGDGKKFLVAKPVGQSTPEPFRVVLHWQGN